MTIALFTFGIFNSPLYTNLILCAYFVSLLILFIFGAHAFVMVYYYMKQKGLPIKHLKLTTTPVVTIQLPVYNELYVVNRLIDSICAMDYPKDKLEIQVLDDSTDETITVCAKAVEHYQKLGYDIKHIRRSNRKGFKAGALKCGLETARGEFIGIFDADFVPNTDFLEKTIPYFYTDSKIGVVQTRWAHINGDYSLLTRAQAFALDAHHAVEQNVRCKAGFFINFNGTGGVWRKAAILDAGNWQADTLTEDLDLSYRAQLRGWKFQYLCDVTSPAELPAEVNALKTQQFRWTKGAIETARKMLPEIWKSKLSLRMKIHSTSHLTSNIVFPFIILAGILNVPLIFIKQNGGHEAYFALMSVFVIAFVGSFLFYLIAQKTIYPDWRRRIMLFPLFMAGSMGFAVNNSRAVFEGLFKRKSEFVRTPKSGVKAKGDSWKAKKYAVKEKFDWGLVIEIVLAVYCLFGVISSLYYMEIAALPFQLLYFTGFAAVSWLSIRQAFETRKFRH
jgi:cellulose synthase/poly-beta-1,6-N-acetylglucosamine synthase-like glycosyltransferase